MYEAFFLEQLLHPCITGMENYLFEYEVLHVECHRTLLFNYHFFFFTH